MDKNIALVAQVVAELTEMGITAVEKPSAFRAYEGAWGSISNYVKVILGEIRELQDPLGNVHLGVYVRYEAFRESGEDLCDFSIRETRNILLDRLVDYLAEKGIVSGKKRAEDRVVRMGL